MNRAAKILAVFMVLALVPLFADNVPIGGNVTGTFSGIPVANGNGTNTWIYDSNSDGSSTLTFAGNSFSGLTGPILGIIDLGTLTDNNSSIVNKVQNVTATLTVDVDFTTPNAGDQAFAFTVGVDEHFLLGFGADAVVDLSTFNGPSTTFSVGSEEYTVTLDGFWAGIIPLSFFDTGNDNSNSADLWATITSSPLTPAVPEPASVILLASAGGMMALSLRRRKKT